MARKTKQKSSCGGPRPNSGRKPKPITDFNRTLCERLPDALYALNLHTRTMRDTAVDLELRLDCAKEVMNRILGKPRQAVEVKGQAARVIVEYRGRGIDPTARGSGEGPD